MRKREIADLLNDIFDGEERVELISGSVLFEMPVEDGSYGNIVRFLRQVNGLKEILKTHGYEMELKKLGVKDAISKSHSFAFYGLLD